jgi:hypothetical protein
MYGAKLLKKTDQIPAVYCTSLSLLPFCITHPAPSAATAARTCSGTHSAASPTAKGQWTACGSVAAAIEIDSRDNHAAAFAAAAAAAAADFFHLPFTPPPPPLQKSGKIAENVFQSQSSSGIASVGFYLQILERYLYFYNQGTPAAAARAHAHLHTLTPANAGMPGMEARIINELLERVQGYMASIEPKSEVKACLSLRMPALYYLLKSFTGGCCKHRAPPRHHGRHPKESVVRGCRHDRAVRHCQALHLHPVPHAPPTPFRPAVTSSSVFEEPSPPSLSTHLLSTFK